MMTFPIKFYKKSLFFSVWERKFNNCTMDQDVLFVKIFSFLALCHLLALHFIAKITN